MKCKVFNIVIFSALPTVVTTPACRSRWRPPCGTQHYRLYSVPTMPVGNVPNFIAGNVPIKQVGNAALSQLPASTRTLHCQTVLLLSAFNKVFVFKTVDTFSDLRRFVCICWGQGASLWNWLSCRVQDLLTGGKLNRSLGSDQPQLAVQLKLIGLWMSMR